VVGGHRQKDGIDYDEVFAPVGKFESLRCIFALAALYDWELHSVDISNAFLNGVLSEPVYMALPEGYNDKAATHCWKLHKALYGLKQAPKEWFKVLADGLRSTGFVQSDHDQALWVAATADPTNRVVTLHWVDDLILGSPSAQRLAQLKSAILTRFKGRDLGEVKSYLNIVVERDRSQRTLKLSQSAQVQQLLTKFRQDDCKPRPVPMQPGADCSKSADSEEEHHRTRYMEAVGSLLYITGVTRPDLATATGLLAKSMSRPSKRHWSLLRHVLGYLQGTQQLGLVYTAASSNGAQHTDSDFAACKDTRRSRSGQVTILAGAAVSWSSRQQTCVATSTAEAEYIAGATAARTVTWLRRLCTELDGQPRGPVQLQGDNKAMLHMAVNSADSAKTKHVDVSCHYLRQCVSRGVVSTVYVATDENVADLFTKPLGKVKFQKFRAAAGMQ